MVSIRFQTLCPVTAALLDATTCSRVHDVPDLGDEEILLAVRDACRTGRAPFFLPDVCTLELTIARVGRKEIPFVDTPERTIVNPSLEICELESVGCLDLISGNSGPLPTPGKELILVWKKGPTESATACTAEAADLAAIKIVAEALDPAQAEAESGVSPGLADILLRKAVDKGILLSPPSLIRRSSQELYGTQSCHEHLPMTDIFTLQWHLTQACDLFCRHCYDRSPRASMPEYIARRVLDDFSAMCRERRVRGQISFSGGNPLLYPGFLNLYAKAVEMGLYVAILGNPTDRETLASIRKIAPPAYYQVSLEGLPAHNDAIRGTGHFQRTLDFLDILRELGVQGQVMLTLTRDNMDQIIPLAEILEGRVWGLSFNRLSPVGRGAALALPDPEEFQTFLAAYCKAAARLGVLSFKDNMLNAHLARTGQPTFGGCTGFGCGAAFNFMALLPDGEVHACRKFPSLIGSLTTASLGDIYDGPDASRYRTRSSACRGCALVAECGGCLSVVSGLGLDIASARDPFCPGPIEALKESTRT